MIKNKFGTNEIAFDPIPLQSCDEWLSTVVDSLEIDLMPGKLFLI
jgi:hypothetical protein